MQKSGPAFRFVRRPLQQRYQQGTQCKHRFPVIVRTFARSVLKHPGDQAYFFGGEADDPVPQRFQQSMILLRQREIGKQPELPVFFRRLQDPVKLKGKHQDPFAGLEAILIFLNTADTAAGQVDLQHKFLVKRAGDLFPRRMVQLVQ